MKKILVIIILLVSLKSFGQTTQLPMIDGKVVYTEVVTLDSSFKKDDLYINAKKFFIDIFNSGKDVIQMEDKDAGIVIGKGFTSVNYKVNFLHTFPTKIWHTVKISIKEGKYKFEITNMTYYYLYVSDNQFSGRTISKDVKGDIEDFPKHNKDLVYNQVDKDIKDEIKKLKSYMSKKQSTSDF